MFIFQQYSATAHDARDKLSCNATRNRLPECDQCKPNNLDLNWSITRSALQCSSVSTSQHIATVPANALHSSEQNIIDAFSEQ